MLRFSRGFSLVDVIVGIALLLVLFLALFGILRVSLILSTLAKAEAAAIQIGNTQIEYLRGLSYNALGTAGGIPSGSIPGNATTTMDGVAYGVRTFIEYYDDPADGVYPADTIPTDYKIGKVTVSYSIYGFSRSITLISNFVPPSGEAATGGGALQIHVVDASGNNLPGASVQVVNTALSPAVNFTTSSNISGIALIGGAATSSQYQIFVSRPGYSSAQTYNNPNPTPGYLTVAQNLVTSATFAIDRLASLTLASFSPASTTSFSDSFGDASNLSSQTGTNVSGGDLALTANIFSGVAHSIPFSPSFLDGWGVLDAALNAPSNSAVLIHVDDTSGNRIPDSDLPGNSAGFSSFPVFLTGLSTSTYPGLSIEADISRNSTSTMPLLSSWSLSHTSGPVTLPNQSFTLTGTKTVGSTLTNVPIYKTVLSDTTGTSGSVTEPLEWDTYALSSGATILESCIPAPYTLMPGNATTSALIIGTLSANALRLSIVDASGNPVANALVVLTGADYAATVPASSCGLAIFNNLTAGTYTAAVSAPGHAPTTFTGISVAGKTAQPVTLP